MFWETATKNLVPNRDRIHFIRDGEEFLPGVQAILAPGHTVGHTIFMISSGNQQLCCIADLSYHPVLLLEHPLTQFAYDTDPVQSSHSRVKSKRCFATLGLSALRMGGRAANSTASARRCAFAASR